jgi:predicted AAA+ superfamily ATPase
LPRVKTSVIEHALKIQVAVALIGLRQAGKTTRALQIGDDKEALYLGLEYSDYRNKLQNPALFLESLTDRLINLDEIHRLPSL